VGSGLTERVSGGTWFLHALPEIGIGGQCIILYAAYFMHDAMPLC
jgi:hypothetical protein